jgi:hypothetical protein
LRALQCFEAERNASVVITGLDPVIHAFFSSSRDKDVDGRVKPGHDE